MLVLCIMDLLFYCQFLVRSQLKELKDNPNHLISSLVFVIADFITAMLIRVTGQNLQMTYSQSLKSLNLVRLLENSEILSSGDIAALVYLWNPFTIVTCVGFSTSPIENLVIMMSIYGACARRVPLTAFGWVMATHLSLYPAILVIPIILLLGYGPDTPPRKLLLQWNSWTIGDNHPSSNSHCLDKESTSQPADPPFFSWRPVLFFFLWASFWASYVLILCGISVKQYGGLWEMFKRSPMVSAKLPVVFVDFGAISMAFKVSHLCNLFAIHECRLETRLYTWVCWACLLTN
ncbi:hypothetical protein F0562_012698 [Nyssa sinensis]|uniref:GPI transamidase subunit PIG-U n=1 Tax=Nyssa sinensis TaxID=561372 RepID=A0A5J4ZWD9_9ASTE|nr:hypothetical protein F0562_012698 [Nyssa sinensis]